MALRAIENFLQFFASVAGQLCRTKGFNVLKKTDHLGRIILSLLGLIIFSVLFFVATMIFRSAILNLY